MRKMFIALLTIAVFFSFNPMDADAKRGGFKSPKGSYQQTPSKSTDNVTKTEPAKSGTTTGGTGAATGNRGFFSGGSLMKGLMIGGFAGLLFGGFFGAMGGFGEFLGLLFNILIIYMLFRIGRALYVKYQERKAAERRRY